jgi:cytochrome c peroxidase
MHDGSLKTLDEVLDFYRSEELDMKSNDPRTKSLINYRTVKDKHDMTDKEKADIIAFLKTFTDKELMNDERFSNPFYERVIVFFEIIEPRTIWVSFYECFGWRN